MNTHHRISRHFANHRASEDSNTRPAYQAGAVEAYVRRIGCGKMVPLSVLMCDLDDAVKRSERVVRDRYHKRQPKGNPGEGIHSCRQ